MHHPLNRQQGARMLTRSMPPRLARLGCQPLALRTPLLLRTLAAKAERKAGKKAAQALKLTRALQQEEAQAFRSGKVLSTARHSTARDAMPATGLEGACTRRCCLASLWCHRVIQVLPHEHDATCSLIERAVSSHRAASTWRG